jgi:hypothetical protein
LLGELAVPHQLLVLQVRQAPLVDFLLLRQLGVELLVRVQQRGEFSADQRLVRAVPPLALLFFGLGREVQPCSPLLFVLVFLLLSGLLLLGRFRIGQDFALQVLRFLVLLLLFRQLVGFLLVRGR